MMQRLAAWLLILFAVVLSGLAELVCLAIPTVIVLFILAKFLL